MRVYLARSNKAHSKHKKDGLKSTIQTGSLSLTLPADVTKIDADIKPFWNELSKEIHSILWQPHQIESPEQDSRSLNGSLNYQVGALSFWKRKILPINLTQKPSLLSLPALSVPIMESETETVISKKIRICPENEKKWEQALNIYRCAYNGQWFSNVQLKQ